PAATPPTVPAPAAPPAPPPTGGTPGLAVGHGIGLFGRQITVCPFPFPFRHRKGLPLPLSHGRGRGLGLGSGGDRVHSRPPRGGGPGFHWRRRLAGRAGQDWTGRVLKFFMK